MASNTNARGLILHGELVRRFNVGTAAFCTVSDRNLIRSLITTESCKPDSEYCLSEELPNLDPGFPRELSAGIREPCSGTAATASAICAGTALLQRRPVDICGDAPE